MNNKQLEKNIRKYIEELLSAKNYISQVDVIIKLGYLSKTDYENWRKGKVEFLEKICQVNLTKLTTISKMIKGISTEMNLKESWTAYMKYGKGEKKVLRFSKSNDEQIEKRYATHYVKRKLE